MDSQRKDERGFAMAALLVGIAIMMVFLGVAMPVWNQQAKREKEEELLFRLKQYAHAIALYQRRMPGAQPPSIDLLVQKRFLRRKYLDPVTGKDFAILRVGQISPGMTSPLPGMTVPQPGGQEAKGPSGFGQGSRPTDTRRSGSSLGAGSQTTGGGAIRGVVSTSTESSLRVWKGRSRYDHWEVTPEDIVPRFGPTVVQPGQGGPGNSRPGVGRPGGPSGGTTSPRPTTPVRPGG